MQVVTYEIARDDSIRSVGGAWSQFARENDAPELVDGVIGRPLWDFLDGPTTRDVYSRLVQRARSGRELTFHLRCDSPTARRFMRMRMLQAADFGVRFETELLTTDHWPRRRPRRRADDVDTLLTVCSWCGRAHVDNRWEEPELAVEHLGIFVGTRTPAISHGICPSCAVAFEKSLLLV